MTDDRIELFLQEFKECYYKASGKEEQNISIRLGSEHAKLHFSNQHIAEKMSRSLAHLKAPSESVVLNTLSVFCFEGNLSPFSFPWTPADFEVQGLIKGMNTDRFQTIYQHGSGAIILFDQLRKEGFYYIDSATNIPYWEVSFPFRTLFHWWTRDTPYQLLHAGGIGDISSSMIITGKSGSGKSSTCLSSLLHQQLFLAGDDYVLIDTQKGILYSLYNCVKIEWGNLERLNFLKKLTDTKFKDADKAMIFVNERCSEKILTHSELHYSFIPVISREGKTKVIESNPAEALKSIAPTTLFQLPLIRTEAFGKCVALVKRLRTYQVMLGTDPGEIAETLYVFLNKDGLNRV